MKKAFKFYLLALFGFFYNGITAQVVTKTEVHDGTELTISMDKKIDQIIGSLEEKCAEDLAAKEKRNSEPETPKRTETTETAKSSRPLTNAEICRQNPRILGYKIQLAVVKSKAEADEVGMYFRRRFPYIKVEQDASLRPNYKVWAGSYFSKESARGDLKKIREFFKSAIPVQYRIFCAEAK